MLHCILIIKSFKIAHLGYPSIIIINFNYKSSKSKTQMIEDYHVQDYDDIYTGLTSEITKNINIRFYAMEDYFQFTFENANQKQKSKVSQVHLPFNRIIQQSITDLYIMNKLIYGKAKVVATILQNGRNIWNKKPDSWNDFIKQKHIQKIAKAFHTIPSQSKRELIKYTVLSLSNLFLKLSINMSKVSVICIQNPTNFQCLSLCTLSVVFLQNLQYRLFKSKNFADTDNIARSSFMRQLPKITYIKLTRYRNNTDFETLGDSQQNFIDKPAGRLVKNLQYIQIYEKREDPFNPEKKQLRSYMHSIDLEGYCKAPFTFQILEVMRNLVFPLVKQFKPDLIVYMQSYPSNQVVMNDEVRGLMFCQMAEETTCNKMYIFKQVGINKLEIKDYSDRLKVEKRELIDQKNSQIFSAQEKKIANKYITKSLINKQEKEVINKLKKIFINQLSYTSLALIQKTSFQEILQKSHRHLHQEQFLAGLEQILYKAIKEDGEEGKNNMYDELTKILDVRMKGVKMMRDVLKFKKQDKSSDKRYKIINLSVKKDKFNSFYNIERSRQEELFIFDSQKKKRFFTYTENDYLIVKYLETETFVIIIRSAPEQPSQKRLEVVILSLKKQENNFNLEFRFLCNENQHDIQGATYTWSNHYLYRAFGRFRHKNENQKEKYNKKIDRLQIRPFPDQDFKWEQWKLVATQGITLKSDGKQQPKAQFESKIYGYGFYDGESSKAILMMGGYIDSYNQERISKNIYFIKNPDSEKMDQLKILKMGKTNKIVYNPPADKIKDIFLYPFVFGIPLLAKGAKNALILNSNGYYLNLNHNKKIFTTNVKLSQYMMYIGVNIQNKLKIDDDAEKAATSIFLSQILIKCTVAFQTQINIRGPSCCIKTLQDGLILIEVKKEVKDSKDLEKGKIFVMAPEIFQDEVFRQINFI